MSKSNDLFFLRCVFQRHDAACHVSATRKSRLGDLLIAHTAVAILSMAKSSCADRSILVVGILTNTPFLFLNKHFPNKHLWVSFCENVLFFVCARASVAFMTEPRGLPIFQSEKNCKIVGRDVKNPLWQS